MNTESVNIQRENTQPNLKQLDTPREHGLDDKANVIIEILLEHPLIKEALALLSKELPADLSYHNYNHTIDVLTSAIKLGVSDGLREDDLTLLGIAAAWHDTGFIKQFSSNEPIAAQWARDAMEKSGFPEHEIADVERAILDTQLKLDPENATLVQISNGRLSPWLLDADLSNFGSNTFLQKSLKVYSEFSKKQIEAPSELQDDPGKAYIVNTIKLVANHKWHSQAAKKAYTSNENENLKNLGILLANLYSGTAKSLEFIWTKMLSAKSSTAAF